MFLYVHTWLLDGTALRQNRIVPFDLKPNYRRNMVNILVHSELSSSLVELFQTFPPLRATFTQKDLAVMSKLRCSFAVCFVPSYLSPAQVLTSFASVLGPCR